MATGTAGATALNLTLRLLLAVAVAALAACGGGGDNSTGDAAPLSSSAPLSADVQQARRAPGSGLVGQPPTVVNSTTAGDQIVQDIGALADGGYAVAWLSSGGSGTTSTTASFYVQRYDALGAKQGLETRIQYDFASGTQPAVAVLGDGGVVVAYRSATPVTSSPVPAEITSIDVRRFDANGMPVGEPTRISSAFRQLIGAVMYETVDEPGVIAWEDGSYLVSWAFKDHRGVYGVWVQAGSQRFDSQGQPVGGASRGVPQPESIPFEFIEIEHGGYVFSDRSTFFAGQRYYLPGGVAIPPFDDGEFGVVPTSTVVGLTGGGFALIYWSGNGEYRLTRAGQSGPWNLYRQIFDSTGVAVGAPAVITGPQSSISRPGAPALRDGGFVALWKSSNGQLTAQRFNPAGVAVGEAFQLASGSIVPKTVSLVDGGLALAWTSAGAAGDLDVLTQRLEEADFGGKPDRARKRACQAEAKGMTGAERKQFMKDCLGK